MTNSVKLPGNTHWCPRCQKQLNGASAVDGTWAVPKDEDASICAYCGLIVIFRGDHLEPMTTTELAKCDDEDREMLIKAGRALGFGALALTIDPKAPRA